jgi:hypothetical protein
MVTKSDNAIIENVGGVDEQYLCENVVPNTSFPNMENVHLETIISLENVRLETIISLGNEVL